VKAGVAKLQKGFDHLGSTEYLPSIVTSGDYTQMGKYIGYVILIIVVIFVLEWFQIVDVPFLEIPDSISRKKEMVDSSKDVLEEMN
jgi:hypothetical protein